VLTNRARSSSAVAAGARRLEENAYALPRPRVAVGLAPGSLDRASNVVSRPRANAIGPLGLSLDDREPEGSR
jgi:hypothetical protein